MKKCYIFIFALLALLITTENQALAAEDSFKAETFYLKNGMEVVVVPNTKMPVVSQMVWYKTGAADEPTGKSGIAHFLEHLMFKGTKNHESGEFSKKIAKVGGNDNAFTDTDYTAYFQTIPKNSLEMAMSFESDRMHNLIINKNEVLKERDVILEERRSRIDNNPQALLQERMKAALYLNHPYHRPLIGWYHEMASLSAEDAQEWYNNYYNPSNAILVVSGDVTTDEVRTLAEKYYGKIKSGKKHNRSNFTQEPPHITPIKLELKDSKVAKPVVLRYYLAPSRIYGHKEYSYALALLSYILGASDTSLMYQDMVLGYKEAVEVGSYYDDLKIGPSIFMLRASPNSGVPLEKIEEAFDRNVNNIIKNGINAADLARAKRATIAESIYNREDLKTLANAYGAALSIGLDTDYVENWDQDINAVTATQIQEAAKYIFDKKHSVTGYLLPEGEE